MSAATVPLSGTEFTSPARSRARDAAAGGSASAETRLAALSRGGAPFVVVARSPHALQGGSLARETIGRTEAIRIVHRALHDPDRGRRRLREPRREVRGRDRELVVR